MTNEAHIKSLADVAKRYRTPAGKSSYPTDLTEITNFDPGEGDVLSQVLDEKIKLPDLPQQIYNFFP